MKKSNNINFISISVEAFLTVAETGESTRVDTSGFALSGRTVKFAKPSKCFSSAWAKVGEFRKFSAVHVST